MQGGGVATLLVEKLKGLKVERINNKKEITVQPFNHSTIKLRKQCALTKPSRGTSRARVELQSTETLSFRCCSERCHLSRGAVAFTLAEVLITLAIIGVVAALTIPSLIMQNQEKGWSTAGKVFEAKLSEALKVMNTQQNLSGYKTTEDFVNELSNHIKITKICDNTELSECFEDKVYWGSGQKEVDMSKIKTALQFGHDNWKTKVVGVNFANGVTGVIAYNPECKQNPYDANFSPADCYGILYDVSGYANPNSYGKDLKAHNVPNLDGDCAFKFGGTCATAPIRVQGLSKSECEKIKAEGLVKDCPRTDTGDTYAAAVKYCHDLGKRLPNASEFTTLSQDLYNTSDIHRGAWQTGLTLDESKKDLYGFGGFNIAAPLLLWTDRETEDGSKAYFWAFYDYAVHSAPNRKDPTAGDLGIICID